MTALIVFCVIAFIVIQAVLVAIEVLQKCHDEEHIDYKD